MSKKFKIDKKHIIPALSFVLFIGFLISIISLIDATFAVSIFGIIATLLAVVFHWVKGSADFLISKWERLDDMTHLGLIGIAILGFLFIIFYFIKNFTIKVISRNEQ